jgi:hypothetical protein
VSANETSGNVTENTTAVIEHASRDEDVDELPRLLNQDPARLAAILRQFQVIIRPAVDETPALVVLLCRRDHLNTDYADGPDLLLPLIADEQAENQPQGMQVFGMWVSQRDLNLGRLVVDALEHEIREHGADTGAMLAGTDGP